MSELVLFLVGAVGAPLVNWLKGLVGSDNNNVNLAIAAGVSVLLAVIALLWSGDAVIQDFTADNLPEAFGLVFSGATVAYKLLLKFLK